MKWTNVEDKLFKTEDLFLIGQSKFFGNKAQEESNVMWFSRRLNSKSL